MFVRRDDSAIEKKIVLIFTAAHSCVLVQHFSCVEKEKNVLLFLNGEYMYCFSSMERILIFYGKG